MQHQGSGLAYNGIKPTQEGLSSPRTTAGKSQPTLDHWHSRGGLVGRGVLVDFKGYMELQSMPYHCFDGYRITVEDIETVAKHQIWENLMPENIAKVQQSQLSGLHGSVETARWLRNKHFSAVAGDCQSCEAYPPLKPDGTVGSAYDLGKFKIVG